MGRKAADTSLLGVMTRSVASVDEFETLGQNSAVIVDVKRRLLCSTILTSSGTYSKTKYFRDLAVSNIQRFETISFERASSDPTNLANGGFETR